MPSMIEARARFRSWFVEHAVPFQRAFAKDDVYGGFHERLTVDAKPVSMPRRARVSARQLYAFSQLAQDGMETIDLAKHAWEFLSSRHLRPTGEVVSTFDPESGVESETFDLYDYAFVLFSLSVVPNEILPRADAAARATAILDYILPRWKPPIAGFEEASPRRLPLRANPHMHLFEASLSWMAGDDADSRFSDLADEIAELCLARFIDPRSSALRELFDGDWEILDDADVNLVEPGHQYEWAWLLFRWGNLRSRPEAVSSALRLAELAERRGMNSDGLVASTLTPTLEIADPTARLWPHTEQIKFWSRLYLSSNEVEEEVSRGNATVSCERLFRFLDHPASGSWWENIGEGGQPHAEPARTSSLYHIVGAYCELLRN